MYPKLLDVNLNRRIDADLASKKASREAPPAMPLSAVDRQFEALRNSIRELEARVALLESGRNEKD